jgi:arylsulfatase A
MTRPITMAIALTAICFACIPIPPGANGSPTAQPPNIVLVFADDLAINDLGCYGRKEHHTPNLDHLASQGMRFTCAYAAQPICSPSRAAILTGKCPARLNLTNFLPGRADAPSQRLIQPRIEGQLPLEEVTIAEILKDAGYATGLFGKWHLGGSGFGPQEQGFDVAFTPPATDEPTRATGGKGEFAITAAAEKFIEQNRNRPFFCYVPHNCPHIPLSAASELVENNRDAFNPTYAAMIETLDDSVGRLMKKIESLDLSQRTIFIFTSDNGGLHVLESPGTPSTHNTPFRAGKGFLYEGGLREPLVVRWPGKVAPGSTCDTPIVLTDLVPTLLEAAGIDAAKAIGPLDGVSIMKRLRGEALPPRTLYWHFPHYTNQGGRPAGAIREGDWKLVEQFEDGRAELYDLAHDPSETKNFAAIEPGRVAELRGKLQEWRAAVGARMPTSNPDFDAALHRQLYVDQDPSKLVAESTAAETAPQWKEWRLKMNAAVKDRKPAVTPATGDIRLHASEAVIHGKSLRYEPQPNKNVLGYWTNAADWPEWRFKIDSPGLYEVEIQHGCDKGSGGADVAVEIDKTTLNFVVQDTGHFQNMILRTIGDVKLGAGDHVLAVKPKSRPGKAIMDLRRIVLRPAPGNERLTLPLKNGQ